MFKLTADRSIKGRELRACVVETLQAMIDEDKQVVAMDADLGGASGFTRIKKSHPDHFIQCGISEANMIGVACGMSAEGYKPFVHTFGPFASRRVFDQVYLSGAYAHNTINIFGSDPGFTVGPNGGTHTTWEDVALMRTIPGAVVCDAADDVQLSWIIREFAKYDGVHYVRANRKSVRNVYEEGSSFELGKGNIVRKGNEVLIIVAGQLVSEALDTAERFEKNGLACEVIDMFTIKPLDKELLLKEIPGKKAVITFENHSINGGLGSAVSEVIADERLSVNFKRYGVNERFGQVGTPAFLQKEFKLTAEDLYREIEAML